MGNDSALAASGGTRALEISGDRATAYQNVFTPAAVAALDALARFDADRKALMSARVERRADRARNRERIAFLDRDTRIGRTNLTVLDARAGALTGSEIPNDLQRQAVDPGHRPGGQAERPA